MYHVVPAAAPAYMREIINGKNPAIVNASRPSAPSAATFRMHLAVSIVVFCRRTTGVLAS